MQTQRKSDLENIVVVGVRNLDEFDSTRIQLRKGAPHFQRDDFVLLAVKDVDFRNLILRENRFQGSHVVKPVPEEGTQRDADLGANHIVYGGESRNYQNFADQMFGGKLECGCPSE